MSKKSDEDPISPFFRKAASHYKVEYNENDWLDLKKRLDEEERRLAAARRSRRWKYSAAAAVSVLLISSVLMVVLFDSDKDETSRVNKDSVVRNQDRATQDEYSEAPAKDSNTRDAIAQAEQREKTQAQERLSAKDESSRVREDRMVKKEEDSAPKDKRAEDRTKDSNTHDAIAQAKQQEEVQGQKRVSNSRVNKIADQNQAADETSKADQKATARTNVPYSSQVTTSGKTKIQRSEDERVQKDQGERTEETGKTLPAVPSQTEDADSKKPLIAEFQQPVILESQGGQDKFALADTSQHKTKPVFDPLQMADSLSKEKLSAESITEKASVTGSEEEDKDTNPRDRWSIILAIAPDFSATGLLDGYTAPGESFGGMIGYHFLNRFSVMTGVFKSSKKYRGEGYEYNTPRGYWKNNTNGVIPERIDGACNVLEIPLMVRYNLAGSGKYNVFVSAGVSSYLLTSEKYDYTFASPNPGSKSGWSSERDSRYLFNISNISVGYERFLLPNLAIGIEPYVKIPLSGMGWSDINIFSTGAYLTVRYRMLKKEARSSRTREGPE